jgi:hypothetical protein
MLTAHLPSGYIFARVVSHPIVGLMPIALIGAVFPDFDMFFFHFVDHGAIHHHHYWVHIPFFWLCVAMVSLPLLKWRGYLAQGLVFFAAITLHLILDTIGGGIAWRAPFDMALVEWVTVPATQSHWVWSFVLHWTFLIELIIWIIAGALLWRQHKGSQT